MGFAGVICGPTEHSRHHTPPSPSPFAALSNFLPQPGVPFFLSSFKPQCLTGSFFPPQTRQDACHREPWGPGTTPRSIGETDLWHPGHELDVPKRGKEDGFEVAGAVRGGRSYLLDDTDTAEGATPVEDEWAGEVEVGLVDQIDHLI